MTPLAPDREALLRFAGIMFKRADKTGFVSLRVFRGLGLVPIQLLLPRWNPAVGMG